MKLTYLGHSCFLLEAEDGTRLVTDPYTGVGYEMPPVSAEYVCCSHGHFDHDFVRGVRGAQKIVRGTGEFACGAFRLRGIASFHDEVEGAKRGLNTVYCIECDGVRVCHMGDIGTLPEPALVREIGACDVLLVPCGGTYTVDAGGAAKWVRALSPRVAVGMHFRPADGTLDISDESGFLRAVGGERLARASLEATDLKLLAGKAVTLERTRE